MLLVNYETAYVENIYNKKIVNICKCKIFIYLKIKTININLINIHIQNVYSNRL